jgi:hypothetical protein
MIDHCLSVRSMPVQYDRAVQTVYEIASSHHALASLFKPGSAVGEYHRSAAIQRAMAAQPRGNCYVGRR